MGVEIKKQELLRYKMRLLAYAMTVGVGVTSLTGCNNYSNGFVYEISGDEVKVEGAISYEQLKKLQLIRIVNNVADWEKCYLVEIENKIQRYGPTRDYYVDIETDKRIYVFDDDEYSNFEVEVLVENMLDYMVKYNMVKDEYTIDDIKELKEKLLKDESLLKTRDASKKVLSKKS